MYVSDILQPEFCVKLGENCFAIDGNKISDKELKTFFELVLVEGVFHELFLMSDNIHIGVCFKKFNSAWMCSVYYFDSMSKRNFYPLDSFCIDERYYAEVCDNVYNKLSMFDK